MDVRTVGVDDLDLIRRHREAMFQEAGFASGTLRTMTEYFCNWLRPRLADGSYFGFLLIDAAQPVAGIGLC